MRIWLQDWNQINHKRMILQMEEYRNSNSVIYWAHACITEAKISDDLWYLMCSWLYLQYLNVVSINFICRKFATWVRTKYMMICLGHFADGSKITFWQKSLNRCGSEIADMLIDTACVFKHSHSVYSFKYWYSIATFLVNSFLYC